MRNETIDCVMAAVDDARVIALEQAMVRIPSFTFEERALALFLYKYMKQAGLEVELQAVPIGDEGVGIQPVGRLRGTGGGSSLLLSGHMDFWGLEEPERWQHPPFAAVHENGFIYGRGAKDEKGGICAAISAAEALVKSGVRIRGDLIVAPVVAQLPVGRSAGARHLMASGVKADMAIVTENSNLGIATVCVGRIPAKLRMEGAPSSFDTKGTDFLACVSRLIDLLGPNYGTISPGGWLAFQRHASFPGFPMLHYRAIDMSTRSCTVTINVRTVPGQTVTSVQSDFQRVMDGLRGEDPHYRGIVEMMSPVHYPHSISEDDELVQAISTAHQRVRGSLPEIGLGPRRGGVDDSWFFIGSGLERTTVYGPGVEGPDLADAPDERISTKDLVDCARVYALTALAICGTA